MVGFPYRCHGLFFNNLIVHAWPWQHPLRWGLGNGG